MNEMSSKLDHYGYIFLMSSKLDHYDYCSCSGRACSAQTCSGRVYSAKINKFRKSIRLKEYDYRSDGAYFITLCTNYKKNIIKKEEKDIIEKELLALPMRFSGVKIDIYSITSNHIHFIIWLSDSQAPLPRIIQAFKSLTTLKIKKRGFRDKVFWQKNYYEHVIRNEKALQKIREYILNNPAIEKLNLEEIYENQ